VACWILWLLLWCSSFVPTAVSPTVLRETKRKVLIKETVKLLDYIASAADKWNTGNIGGMILTGKIRFFLMSRQSGLVLMFRVYPQTHHTSLHEWSARHRDFLLTTQTLTTAKLPAGFESAIPASERPQNQALDRAVIWEKKQNAPRPAMNHKERSGIDPWPARWQTKDYMPEPRHSCTICSRLSRTEDFSVWNTRGLHLCDFTRKQSENFSIPLNWSKQRNG
jgi:hypothetical protein